MPKFKQLQKDKDGPDFCFYCPGCECDHGVWTTESNNNNAIWQFNGNLENPTVSPSLLIRWGQQNKRDMVCHSIITDGKINYCSDSTHKLSGQTIEIPEYEN